jgi:hypothetical protein
MPDGVQSQPVGTLPFPVPLNGDASLIIQKKRRFSRRSAESSV